MSHSLKIIFAGTPDFAAKHLLALIQEDYEIVAVYCPPDKPAGRGKKLTACATKLLALEHGLTVEQPINFKSPADQQKLAQYQADVMVVVAYGLLLPQVILDTPRLGCINVHGSLLPKWRGAAPIQRSLEAGDPQTGITIMQMDKGLDTGDMILTSSCTITDTDTSASLYEKLAILGPAALLTALAQRRADNFCRAPQDHALASYAKKLDKAEAELDWQMPAEVLHRKIRAYIPWPVAQFTLVEASTGLSHPIRIWQASVLAASSTPQPGSIVAADKNGIAVATGQGILMMHMLQLPGKKPLAVGDILNARADWFCPGNKITGS